MAGRLLRQHGRLKLRRARINISGAFLEDFDFKLEGDFQQSDGIASGNGGSRTAFSITDVFLNWNRHPEANIEIGQYKAPFGLEQLTPDTTIFTIERSQPTGALTPERQVGVQLWGKPLAGIAPEHKDALDYAVGVFNGNNRNITVNDKPSFMYAGRVTVMPFAGKLQDQEVKWRLGANAVISRYAAGTRVSQTGNLKENADGSLTGFTVPASSSARSTSWGVDQSLTVGPFDLIAEYLEAKIEPVDSAGFAAFTASGYYVQGGYYFPGRKFQLIREWESFNPGQAPDDDLRSAYAGLNYYIKGDSLKLMANYVHTRSEFRKNHPALGRREFNGLLVRAQVMF